MIDWIKKLFGWKTDEKKEWKYDQVKIPLRSPAESRKNDKILYNTRVRYTENGHYQIYMGKPKNVGWKTVSSDTLRHIIKEQIND